MRINRTMLLKIAHDTVEKYASSDRTIVAIFMQGSLLTETPLIGNTADIDLFFVHTDEVTPAREILRVSDEVTLDISHHSHSVYRQPRELRVDPWLGPAVYDCKILYDPQHFLDFVQAGVRGQFNSAEHVLRRVRKQARHGREIWEGFEDKQKPAGPREISSYLLALEHAANAVAGLNGQNLTERRLLWDLRTRAEAVHKTGLYAGLVGLLGGAAVDAKTIRSWLPGWQSAYFSLPESVAPVRLHPFRWPYYERAVDVMLVSADYPDALWPLWRTWTHAVCALPEGGNHLQVWQSAGEQLGQLGEGFSQKLAGLDAYLDMIEEVLDTWSRENGG